MQNIRLKHHMSTLKNPTTDPLEWNILSDTISFWTKWFLKINGIKIIKKKLPYEEIYKKYLGEDYSFDPLEKYSLIVSNHTGLYDVIMNMSVHSCGFMAKKETKDTPFVGPIAKGINCLFVKRESQTDRENILNQLEERQRDFYEGRYFAPLLLFPEGTTTNGKYILKFKKGAFYSLLPIKPQVILLDDDVDYSVGIGGSSVGYNYFRSLCYFGCNMNLCELPVIKPTEYMFEHYSDLGNEKWEIFAEVTRNIMCEISGLKKSNRTFRDSKYYENSLLKGTFSLENNDLLFGTS
jgi:lysophosphatidylcholine acyltransferase/lyso-PAF acetyltransferase